MKLQAKVPNSKEYKRYKHSFIFTKVRLIVIYLLHTHIYIIGIATITFPLTIRKQKNIQSIIVKHSYKILSTITLIGTI